MPSITGWTRVWRRGGATLPGHGPLHATMKERVLHVVVLSVADAIRDALGPELLAAMERDEHDVQVRRLMEERRR